VLVSERQIVPAGVADVVGEDRRGPIRPLAVLIEEAVSHGQAPAPRVAARNVSERLKAGLVLLHRAPPDDRVQLGQLDGLAVEPANQVNVARTGGEVIAIVDRVAAEHVVVAGQDHDGLGEPRELAAHERDGIVADAVVIEQIAGDQQEVDLIAQRAVDDAPEHAPLALAVRRLLPSVTVAVALEVDVGGVQHSKRPSRRGHAQQHATIAVHNVTIAPRAASGRAMAIRVEARTAVRFVVLLAT
jgi:hypothetical protein